jgi:hypothetical protein
MEVSGSRRNYTACAHREAMASPDAVGLAFIIWHGFVIVQDLL